MENTCENFQKYLHNTREPKHCRRRRWWYSRRTADYITSQKIKRIYFSRMCRLRGDMFTIWILSSFLLQLFFVVLLYYFCLLLFNVLKMKNTFILKFISRTEYYIAFVSSELYVCIFNRESSTCWAVKSPRMNAIFSFWKLLNEWMAWNISIGINNFALML